MTAEAATAEPPRSLGLSPRRPAPVTPPRAPGSIRRTSSIDTLWPDGVEGDMQIEGRARDIVTPRTGGAPILCAEDALTATLRPDRMIAAIATRPARAAIGALVGARGGGHLRRAIADELPRELADATPLYLLLDDISGASLVASWAWSQWIDDWKERLGARLNAEKIAAITASKENICIGFATGSTAQRAGPLRSQSPGVAVPDLRNPDDPDGWHALADQSSDVGMRRARRIDVTLGERIEVYAAFQDSASSRAGGRVGLHEYLIAATIDPASMRLTGLEADPRILPFPECPAATRNMTLLVGERVSDLRQVVLDRLRGTAGCTHLNDTLRALAEVPALTDRLAAALSAHSGENAAPQTDRFPR